MIADSTPERGSTDVHMYTTAVLAQERESRETGHTPYLAGEDLAKGQEGVVQHLAVDRGNKVLDDEVAGAALAHGRIPVRGHDAHRATMQMLVVEGLQRAVRCPPLVSHAACVCIDLTY